MSASSLPSKSGRPRKESHTEDCGWEDGSGVDVVSGASFDTVLSTGADSIGSVEVISSLMVSPWETGSHEYT